MICPGCGAELDSEIDRLDEKLNASEACRELFNTLTYYTLAQRDSYFIHQLAVDAYAAQHYGNQVKPIGITFALVGLYLVCERGYTGRQVQRVHMALAKKSKTWPQFSAPTKKAGLTVKDVVQVPDAEKQEGLKKWHASVWDIWKSEELTVARLLEKHLGIV